jgi:hypothetical protein
MVSKAFTVDSIPEGRSEAAAHIVRGQAPILVGVQRVEDGIASKPLLPGDAPIPIEIIE